MSSISIATKGIEVVPLGLDGLERWETGGAESNSSKGGRTSGPVPGGRGSKYKSAATAPVIPKAIIGHNRPGERLELFFLRFLLLDERDLVAIYTVKGHNLRFLYHAPYH